MTVNMAEKRVFSKRAKGQRKALQIIIAEILVGERYHLIFQPNGAQFPGQISGNILRQIHTGHECPAGGSGFFNFYRHSFLLSNCSTRAVPKTA